MPKVDESYYEERKHYIIDCAYRVLRKKSLEEMNMRDVIRETGFSQGTIYNYYKSIDEIRSVIIYQYMKTMQEKLSQCIARTFDFKDCYRKICNTMADMYEENPELFKGMLGTIAFNSTAQGNNDVLYMVYQAGEDLNRTIIELLEKGIGNGIVRTDLNLYVAVFHLWSGIGQTIVFSHSKQQYIETQLHMTRHEYMEQGFELVIRSILN